MLVVFLLGLCLWVGFFWVFFLGGGPNSVHVLFCLLVSTMWEDVPCVKALRWKCSCSEGPPFRSRLRSLATVGVEASVPLYFLVCNVHKCIGYYHK